jgi:signal transduction histidine kinase
MTDLLSTIRDELAGLEMNVAFVAAGGRVVTLEGDPPPDGVVPPVPATGRGTFADATVTDGDGRPWLATTMALGPLGAPAGRGLVLATLDRSGAQAVADLLRTVPFVLLVAIGIGGALGWLLARSTVRPLRRLADAAAAVPAPGSSGDPPQIPPEGPTEVRELTDRFNAMTSELAASRRAEVELLANLRHDLRTPLTVIGGFATAIVDGTAEGDAARQAARTIVDETARLERLVDELGAVTGQGGSGLRAEELVADPILAAAAARFAARAERLGATLEVDATEAPGFAADRVAVERMVDNLVENALRALEPGPGGHVLLAARRGVADGRPAVGLAVSDDGPGFPPGALPRVFDRTFRADAARSGAGSGLGLTIVRDLARAHGGDAFAENLAPRGARVSVVLPLVPATLGGCPTRTPSHRLRSSLPPGPEPMPAPPATGPAPTPSAPRSRRPVGGWSTGGRDSGSSRPLHRRWRWVASSATARRPPSLPSSTRCRWRASRSCSWRTTGRRTLPACSPACAPTHPPARRW